MSPQMKNGFIKNMGQISQSNLLANEQVLYYFQSAHLQVQLRRNGFSYQLLQYTNNPDKALNPMETSNLGDFSTQKIDIDFKGAQLNAQIEEFEKGQGQLFFRAKENIEKVYSTAHFNKVLYRNIYPHIDIEFLISDAHFKYNFILHPGADLAQIQLLLKGVDHSSIKENGALTMETNLGPVEEQIPFSYELNSKGKPGKYFKARYKKLGSNLFGFSAEKYSLTKTVVIDPIPWSTYFGGDAFDFPSGIICDKMGNIYIAGRTQSINGFSTVGAYQTTQAGIYDAFLAKFSSAGVLLWATYFGGAGQDLLNDVTIDIFDNIIISGQTGSSSGIATTGAMQTTLTGLQDGYVAKFTPSGAIVWATYFGYDGSDNVNSVSADFNGDLYLTGNTNSTATLFPGVHQNIPGGATDAFVAKISSLGIPVFATYYGGANGDWGQRILVDAQKNSYVVGSTMSDTGIASKGVYQAAYSAYDDIFFAKFDSLGRRVFATYYGGTLNDYPFDMAWDSTNNIVIDGYTASTSGVAFGSGGQLTYGGGSYEGLVVKMNVTGTPLWGTYVGAATNDYLQSICRDSRGNIFCVGLTNSSTGLSTPNALQVSFGGLYDAYLAKLDPSGKITYCSYFGGGGTDYGREMGIDLADNVYFGGESYSTSGIATIGAHQTVIGGSSDIYLVKYVDPGDGSIGNNIISSSQGLCTGNNVAQDLTGTFPSGGDGMFNYQWLFSNSGLPGTYVSAAGANTNDSYSPGTVTVNSYYRRVVFSGTKSDTSNQVSIIVSGSLSNGFTINKKIQCLKDNQFICTDTTTVSAGILSYNWDFGNGKTSSNQIDTVRYAPSVENLYHIRLVTTLDGGCSDTAEQTVIVINNPTQKSILGKDTVMKGTTEIYTVPNTNGSTYNWMFSNGTGRSTNASISIKWTQMGDVNVQVQESNGGGCKGDTASFHVFVKQPTGQEELVASAVQIYPNPSEGVFNIELGSNQNITVAVMDIMGNSIEKTTITGNGKLDLSKQAAGVYIIHLSDENGNHLYEKVQLLK